MNSYAYHQIKESELQDQVGEPAIITGKKYVSISGSYGFGKLYHFE